MIRDKAARPVLKIIEGDGETPLQAGAYLYSVGESGNVGVTYANGEGPTLPNVKYVPFTSDLFKDDPAPALNLPTANGERYPKDELTDSDAPGWYEGTNEAGRKRVRWWNPEQGLQMGPDSPNIVYRYTHWTNFIPLWTPLALRVIHGPAELEQANWLLYRPELGDLSRLLAYMDWEGGGFIELDEGHTAVEIPEYLMEALYSKPEAPEPKVTEKHRDVAKKVWAGMSEKEIAILLAETFPDAD